MSWKFSSIHPGIYWNDISFLLYKHCVKFTYVSRGMKPKLRGGEKSVFVGWDLCVFCGVGLMCILRGRINVYIVGWD